MINFVFGLYLVYMQGPVPRIEGEIMRFEDPKACQGYANDLMKQAEANGFSKYTWVCHPVVIQPEEKELDRV